MKNNRVHNDYSYTELCLIHRYKPEKKVLQRTIIKKNEKNLFEAFVSIKLLLFYNKLFEIDVEK